MGLAPLFRCRGMYFGQPKIGVMKLEGLGMYEGLFPFLPPPFTFFLDPFFSSPSLYAFRFHFSRLQVLAFILWLIDLL